MFDPRKDIVWLRPGPGVQKHFAEGPITKMEINALYVHIWYRDGREQRYMMPAPLLTSAWMEIHGTDTERTA